MGYVSVILVVEDVLESRRFYETVFGLEVEEDHGIYNVGFKGGIALYRRELFRELSGLPCAKAEGEAAVAYFEYEDVREIEARLASFPGARLIHVTREQPWGQLAFRARDSDGHLIEVGEDMAFCVKRLVGSGMTVAAVAEKTGYTAARVTELLSRGFA